MLVRLKLVGGRRWAAVIAPLCLAAAASCAVEVGEPPPDDDALHASVASSEQELVNCSARSDTGYQNGQAFPITVIEVDGKPVERETANHYVAMQNAAAGAGVGLRISSGFRTMADQQYFYGCYINCNCNNCNLAARPGYSNHQSGRALDLNTSAGGVLNWLNANAGAFGFARTVSSEPWHWEWVGGGASVDACGGAVGSDGCTAEERNNAAKFGCTCVNHRGDGGFCPGSGCTQTEIDNCGRFGCGCVDHQCSGGFCEGTGCTALELTNCGKYGCGCVDHQCAGGFCPNSGCTALEITNCGKFGCNCVDHKCAGGFCEGTGCTALETKNCNGFGCDCKEHECAGGFCPSD